MDITTSSVAPSRASSAAHEGAAGETYVLPLSAQQRGLWFIQQLDPESAAFNMPVMLRLTGDLDASALTKALGEIVRRHEMLRTTFTIVNGEPQQEVHPPAPASVTCVDLTMVAEDERQSRARQLRDAERDRPFDLEAGPLLRVTLVRIDERRHELYLVMHHIVTDGWSEAIMVRELTTLYNAFRYGRPSPLPDLPIQYADYALWQIGWQRGEPFERQVRYWRRKLDAVPPLQMPRDHATPPKRQGRGEILPFVLAATLCHDLRALAQREGVTLFTVLLAGFKLLASRYSGQKDFAVGATVANRAREETNDLIGYFVNHLVLRTDLRGASTFRDLVRRVQATTLEAYEHEDVPFDRLVEELNPDRAVGTPLMQAVLVFQSLPAGDLALGDLQVERIPTEYGYSLVDLVMSLREEAGTLIGGLMYSTELFARPTMQRLIVHFDALLARVAAAPDQRLETMPLLTEAEEQRWVVDWNATCRAKAAFQPVQAFVERQAGDTPEATAVIHGDRSLTYSELNTRANRLAHRLRGLGVGPETVVGLCVPRDASMITAMLAILKAGGAYVPLDPSHPAERVTFTLEDADVRVVVTTSALADTFAGWFATLVYVDDAATLALESMRDPVGRSAPEHLAYVIYTSGSTGVPKGVLVTHAGLANTIRGSIEILRVTPGARFAQLASQTFDVSVIEIWIPLCAGGAVCIVDREHLMDGEELARALRQMSVSVLHAVPSVLALLRPTEVPLVDTVVVGGDVCPHELAAPWSATRRVLNGYGPTEATVQVSLSDAGTLPDGSRLAIGRPLPHARIYILDEALNPVPPGVSGEIYIGGAGVARGYRGRPSLTAAHFVPDGFSGENSSRLYRTGDRARFHEAGCIEFLGRVDDQVKLRGRRIELGEIESALQAIEGVRQCVVAVWQEASGDGRLVAYVVPEEGRSIEARALRQQLANRLPEYMVPAAFMMLDALPLTVTGKVHRRGLPAPRFDAETAYVPPRDATEELLTGIWADVLGLPRVGIHDDFFAHGGHSLLAAKVIARAKGVGLDVPLAALFDARTVARVAEIVRTAAADDQAALLPPPVTARVDRDRGAVSFSQQRLWVLDRLEPGGYGYNVPVTMRVRGDLRVEILQQALDEVARRHEVLRTTYPAVDGHPYALVSVDALPRIDRIDLTQWPAAEREARARTCAVAEIQRPFDLARGPLVRVAVLAMGPHDHAVCLISHHIVGDAISGRILLRELSQLYDAFQRSDPSPLPDLPLQFADFAAWERDWLRDEVLARHVGHWRARLAGCAQELKLPADFPRPPSQSFSCTLKTIVLAQDLSTSLIALGRAAGATEFMTLLALFDVWLYRYSGQRDILIGAPVSNRRHVDSEPLIGFFVNTLACRTQIEGSASFANLLTAVRARLLEDYRHQALPIDKVIEELGVAREPNRSPLFQVLFNMVSVPDTEPAVAGLVFEEWDAGEVQSVFDLLLGARVMMAGLELSCAFKRSLFRPATVDRMVEGLGQLARLLVAAPQAPLDDVVAQATWIEEAHVLEQKRQEAQRQRARLRTARGRPVSRPEEE